METTSATREEVKETYTALCLALFWIYYLTQILSYYTYFVFTTFHAIHHIPPPVHPIELVLILFIIGILLSFLCLAHPSLLLAFVAYNVFEVYARRYLPMIELI